MHRSAVKNGKRTPLEEMLLSAIYVAVLSLVMFFIILLVVATLPKTERHRPDEPDYPTHSHYDKRPDAPTTETTPSTKSTTLDVKRIPSARMNAILLRESVTEANQFSMDGSPAARADFYTFSDVGRCEDICQDVMLTECDTRGAVVPSEISSRYRFAVAILKQRYVDDSESFDLLCTGTVVHARWFLTSATCVYESSADAATQLRVRSGSDLWSAGGRLHRVFRLLYNGDRDGVSLGKVDPPFPLGSGIVLTPPSNFVLTPADRLNSVGWNWESRNYKNDKLNSFGVRAISKLEEHFFGRILDTMSCVGGVGFPMLYSNLLIGVQTDHTCDSQNRRYYDVTRIRVWIINAVQT